MTADPDSVRKEFDKAAEHVKASAAGNLGDAVTQLRDAIQDIRDAGFDASLEFFVPGRTNATPPSKAHATALVTLDGLEIDVSIAQHATYSHYTIVQFSVSDVPLAEAWLSGAGQQDRIRASLFDLKARAEHMAQYNVLPTVVKPPRKPKLNT